MTRLSGYLLPTTKDAPADARAVSHALMVRAGLIRQLGAGMWSYLPAGWRAHRRVEAILREEMDAIGGQEMLMPVLQPAEMWRRTGRYEIDELFKLQDRKGADLVLAMTHEEALTYHLAAEISSYRDLPLILYHLQVKERDEPRPRAGILRTREFIMKDSYSFDRDAEGLDRSYELHVQAYDRIFDRSGLEWYRVESDVGMMGGVGAHEYMAPCAAGENEVALSDAGYAANVEIASAEHGAVDGLPDALPAPEPVDTPGASTIEDVSKLLGVPSGALIKALPVIRDDGRPLLVLVRGDHMLNEIKLQNCLGAPARQATPEEIKTTFASQAGFIGPVGARVPVLADEALRGMRGMVAGANEAHRHLRGVEPGRDFEPNWGDVRSVVAGDRCPNGGTIRIEPAIEVGNIFKLGTRYSEPLDATYLDESGSEHHVWMGSYGIGPARIVAAAVEQFADEHGICWPRSLAPFDVELVTLGKEGEEARTVADRLYDELRAAGLDVVYDDRDRSPGQKFADAELLGCPLRLTVGRKGLEAGEVEAQLRRGAERRSLPLEGLTEAAVKLWSELPLSTRRLLGMDRSGGPPPETLKGEPLRPWTIPNLISYVRLALLPVFLVVALGSDDGRDAAAAALFFAIAWGDQLDGLAARLTGQYSRLGALLDPLTDRALVLAGVIVCWHFELLPRWALAILAARELLMLVLTQVGMRAGMDLRINMVGRWAVWPVMFAVFLSLIVDSWVAEASLYLGLGLTLWATAIYIGDGVRFMRDRPSSST